MVALIESLNVVLPNIMEIETFAESQEDQEAAVQLKQSFDKYGSDKSMNNNYHYIYGRVLKDRQSLAVYSK